MDIDVLDAPFDETVLYHSKNETKFAVRNATVEDDVQLMKISAETMPSNGITLSYARHPSYFDASHAQYNRPDLKVVVPVEDPSIVIAMMNLGWRYCYINGQPDLMRYVADLRMNPAYRGAKVMRLLMDYLHDEIPQDTIFESVVLNDNIVAASILHHERSGFPLPYFYDEIRTFTVSQAVKPKTFNQYQFKTLTAERVDEANDFILKMKDHYNFLPSYDFNALVDGQNPFWAGLNLDDFYLIYDQHNQLVGLYGLWNQKSFKQTRVIDYSRSLKLMKPFYNAYASVRGVLSLPKIHGTFDYLMLHSPLCHPEHLDVFASLIFHAKQQTKQRGKETYCITLAEKDPRIEWMKNTTSHVLKAKHYFHSFKANPYAAFDRKRISYFEVGRI
ncbi:MULTISPECIES: GNAT family N-acetyltransferase [unclassified Acinetobacter]|uniref:GNAT family N-acetyltransferase n=1 Tax=unclassified Acinetobacter TaxID=196816 RepID=UPI0015D245F6|nr:MULTISPECIES: GNAT family N-acetyltransferase [unclassified Acinetobacter]UUS61951.1 GNAT family N-acetyltransferase [Acinetobacter sp. YH16056_T]